MIKHLFKMMWNKKKQNALLMLEILISYLVIFAVFTLFINYYQNYRKDRGFEYENVLTLKYSAQASINSNHSIDSKNELPSDSLIVLYESMAKAIKSLPLIKEISFVSNNIPYSHNITDGQTIYESTVVNNDIFTVDDNYLKVMQVTLSEGRWFSAVDDASKYAPIIINKTMKKKLFGNQSPLGKLVGNENGQNQMKVVGVAEDFKYNGDYEKPSNALFKRVTPADLKWIRVMLLKVSPEANIAFEGQLYKLTNNILKESKIEIEPLSKARQVKNEETILPSVILSIISAFLIINVTLGLFGVLWYNINKRKGEIGLRRAVGATASSICRQLIMESVILTLISLVLGILLALQFPILGVFDMPAGTYFSAIILAILFILGIVIVCAYFPTKQASGIYPSVVLREE